MRIPHLNPQGVRHVVDHLASFPRPDRAAADAVRQWAAKRGVELDPDQVDVVTLHHQPGTDHPVDAVIMQRQSLTLALLDNWQGESDSNLIGTLFREPWAGHWPGTIHLVDSLRGHGSLSNASDYQVFNGLFRRSTPQVYDSTTLIDLPAEAFQSFIWNLDLHSHYKAMLDQYWSGQLDSYGGCARLNFVAACNLQAGQRSLSPEGTALAWEVAGLNQASPGLQVRALNVYGYVATDIFYFRREQQPRTLLFIPGNAAPLHEFADPGQMQDWVATQCKDLGKRAALMAHFSAADVPDGLDYSGLATALDGLAAYPERNHLDPNRPGFSAEGFWPPREYVNYKEQTYNPLIAGDLFEHLAQRLKQRSYSDADQLITSNAQVTKARWQNYISSAINYLAPLALVVPALAPLFAIGGAAQFGIGLDRAIEGKTLAEKASGVDGVVFGLLNAAPLAGEWAGKAVRLWRFRHEGFVVPRQINGQLGYAMSPLDPPRLPADDIAHFFHDPDNVAALPGADPGVHAAVLRTPTYTIEPDTLRGEIAGYFDDLIYDVQADAFLRASDENEVDPEYFRPAEPGKGRGLVSVDVDNRPVTDEMRTGTLRALGVDLQLPVNLPAVPLEEARPIPKNILSLWIGEKVLSPSLVDNIAHNVTQLADTDYTLTLYLSNANPDAYAQNLQLLQAKAPALRILPLEEQAVFEDFRQSPYHEQYQAALTGNGKGPAHYASAADVLRYRLLHAEGGLYMDLDDTLLKPGEHPEVRNGEGFGPPGEGLANVPLATTEDGVLLFPPVCNETMANGNMFNNSLIGSHAGNPTLDAISNEMRARYRQTPEFYDQLPRERDDRWAFRAYAQRLSQISGPGLLTDVVTQHLAELRLLRQISQAGAMSQRGFAAFVDGERYHAAMRHLLPLNRLAKIGTNQSWVL
ncbi:dermonecrotic toxin domain-containing protein [Pseudomonas sp. NPDC089401]|uniref:dermonecrotic toxin domain-containing protein n=1 Tax=Pseudomonas sp. NPDC089401 TaxID=3364462 RepID=UPI0037F118D6